MAQLDAAPTMTRPSPSLQVNLMETLEVLHEHLTETLCETVFWKARDRERQRQWSLFALARFWTAVLVSAPESLTQLVEKARSGGDHLLPHVQATPEAFFKKCKTTHSRFFHALFYAFIDRLLPQAPCAYARKAHPLLERFSGIWAVDGSVLDEIAHRMKILWKERAVVLPGSLTVFYDLVRGFSRQVVFDPDATQAEQQRAELVLASIPKDTLLLGDRLYASIRFFWGLNRRQLWGLFRRSGRLKLETEHLIQRRQGGGRSVIEDWLVTAGCGVNQPKITLRWIVFKHGRTRRELLTNVIDPQRLSAEEALALYPMRWSIERLFYDLKEVFGLKSLYAANPNAVAMQVYAAAMVHAAFRIAQANIARAHGVDPEVLSPAKLFPQLAAASVVWTMSKVWFEEFREANPGVRLNEPDWKNSRVAARYGTTTLEAIRVERRSPNRRPHPGRLNRWKSLTHIRGAKLS